jgi:hypothetical protein
VARCAFLAILHCRYSEDSVDISGDQAFPEQANGVFATANLFGVLRIHPTLGRDLLPEEDRADAKPVVLIGHRLWRNRFDSDPNVLGKTLRVNNTAATIVGVMPEGMEFPDNHQIWAPWTPFHAQYAAVEGTSRSNAGRPESRAKDEPPIRQAPRLDRPPRSTQEHVILNSTAVASPSASCP